MDICKSIFILLMIDEVAIAFIKDNGTMPEFITLVQQNNVRMRIQYLHLNFKTFDPYITTFRHWV